MTDRQRPLLVIEDELPIRRVLYATLHASGYAVLTAATAAEGCTQAALHQPALILLDLGLPDLDGLEVTRRLREWATMPIIVLSARGRESDKVAALDAGADDYLTKPFGLRSYWHGSASPCAVPRAPRTSRTPRSLPSGSSRSTWRAATCRWLRSLCISPRSSTNSWPPSCAMRGRW